MDTRAALQPSWHQYQMSTHFHEGSTPTLAKFLRNTCFSLLPTALTGLAADPSTADKSKYSLFNPTPRELMRELSTDRPDKTESAYSVDAGHFQVEMDLVSYAYDHDTAGAANTRVDAWAIAPINFKVGLLNNVDLQTVIETYNHVTIHDRLTGTKTRLSGFGDITSRVKVNLWGND